MRRILVFLFLQLIIATSLLAQSNVEAQSPFSKKGEVAVGYGTAPLFFAMAIIASHGNENVTPLNMHMQYFYYINKRWSVGSLLTYSAFEKNNRLDEHFFSFSPMVRINWFRKNRFDMYSEAGGGIAIELDSGDFGFLPNLSPICLEYGGSKWRGYAEIFTLGMKSWCSIGCKYIL